MSDADKGWPEGEHTGWVLADVPVHMTGLIDTFIDLFGAPRAGSGRLAFWGSDGWVYKLAYIDIGHLENAQEAQGRVGDIPVARAELVEMCGEQVLRMEAVTKVDPHTYIPKDQQDRYDWVRSVDCMQVGVTSRGELVAYDAGRAGEAHRKIHHWR